MADTKPKKQLTVTITAVAEATKKITPLADTVYVNQTITNAPE